MSNQSNQDAGRKPDQIAYNVSPTRDGKGHWEQVGAAWTHKDGKGLDLHLNSTPVNGRVTLREMREEKMQGYAKEREEHAPQEAPARKRSRAYSRS